MALTTKVEHKMAPSFSGCFRKVDGKDTEPFDFTSMKNDLSRDELGSEDAWPKYKNIPVVKQQYLPTTDIVREYNTKRWYEYLKDAFIIFIWMYFITIMGFFITIWIMTADGSKSFLMTHFDVGMVCVLLISIAFSLLLTISWIWCKQRCGSFVLASDQEAERVVITRHSSQSDITDAFDIENPQRNLNRTLSHIGSPMFKYDSSATLNGSICNIYNIPSGYSKITRIGSLGSLVPYQSPESFKRLNPAGCCAAEPQRNI